MSVAEETYELLEPETAAAYIASRPELAALVDTGSLDVQEIGDGNLNLVFVCQDATGRGVVLKQALPYVRLIGPEWPFTPRRAVAEARAYREHGRFAPELIPALYAFDPERYILAVEDLSDHRVWRTALTDGERHDQAAEKMGRYVGRLAFHTSLFGVEAKALKLLAAEAVSPELCEITEDLVLTEPFSGAERNWFQEEIRAGGRAPAGAGDPRRRGRGQARVHDPRRGADPRRPPHRQRDGARGRLDARLRRRVLLLRPGRLRPRPAVGELHRRPWPATTRSAAPSTAAGWRRCRSRRGTASRASCARCGPSGSTSAASPTRSWTAGSTACAATPSASPPPRPRAASSGSPTSPTSSR